MTSLVSAQIVNKIITRANSKNSAPPLIGATMLIPFRCKYFPIAILLKKTSKTSSANWPETFESKEKNLTFSIITTQKTKLLQVFLEYPKTHIKI
jgi:hypothetical protein